MSLAHLNPDKALAEGFLTLLDPETDSFTFQTFDDNKVRARERQLRGERDPLAKWMHGPLDDHWNTLVDLNRKGAGVFVMVQAGDGTGRNNAAVHTIRAVFQEDDGAGRELPLEPHVMVESSPHKYHRYLLVEGLALEDFDAVMPRMIADYGSG